MKTFFGIVVALLIFRIAESVYDGRRREQTNYHGNNFIDVDDDGQGTECPRGFTGPLPYAMDCRQYLNCWKGHGTIQSCAPGTMFNPKSMECDHPSKVKCQRFEEFREQPPLIRSPAAARIECEPGASGLYAHPSDCSKFLNCNNGATFVQDCGPGTMFNARLKVCDWPHNVDCANRQGSNGANRPQPLPQPHPGPQEFPPYYGEGVIQARMYPSATGSSAYRSSNNNLNSNTNSKYPSSVASGNGNANGGYGRLTQSTDTQIPSDNSWKSFNQLKYEGQDDTVHQTPVAYDSHEKTIKCKADWVGLYPHPFDCYKFLNCNNGATFIQDCGPGTAFNPKLQVCDWPHNVNCSRKSVDFDQEHGGLDIEATHTNELLNHEHDSGLSQAETVVQHVTAQPNHVTYPPLSQHHDFNKQYYDESQLKQTPSSANGDYNRNTYSKQHNYDTQNTQLNGNGLTASDIDQYQNTHTSTHSVDHENNYLQNGANKYGQNPVQYGSAPGYGPQSATNQNTFTVENQYGIPNQKPLYHRTNGGVNTIVETHVTKPVPDSNNPYNGHSGGNTLMDTRFAPSNPYGNNNFHPQNNNDRTQYGRESDNQQNTDFYRFDGNTQQNTQFEKITTESPIVSGPTGSIFGANPLPNQFDQSSQHVQSSVSASSQTPPSESKQVKWNAQDELNTWLDKKVDTNLVIPDAEKKVENQPTARIDDPNLPPFASETGLIGVCSMPGLISHPFDCSKFINCENDKAYVQNCAPGTLFNRVLKICDFARKVNCTAGPPVPQEFGISSHLQPPTFNINEPTKISISSGYSKSFTNTPQPATTPPSYQPSGFLIPNMSVLPLASRSDPKYPIDGEDDSEEDDRREPTTPSPSTSKPRPRPVYYPSAGRHYGTDTAPEEIDTFDHKIQRPNDQVVRDTKSVVVNDPKPRPPVIPKEKEHIMPIYKRRTTTSAPNTLSIENQYAGPNDYNKFHGDKQHQVKPDETTIQTDYLPVSEALKLLLRPYANKANDTSAQMLEKKLLEMADRKSDTKTHHSATLEQPSLAHALFNEKEQHTDDENYDYLNFDHKQKHDQNCQHYHPPSTFFHLPPNFKHSPEFHEYMNRKHALSGKEFYIEGNTPSNVELLPGAALQQHGYHHAPPAPLHHHSSHHHSSHQHHHHQHHQTTAPSTYSLAAPIVGDPQTPSYRALIEDGPCNEFNCQNGLCVPFHKVCDGRNDCGNRYDEAACQHVGYEIRLSNERGQKHMGRIEVKAFGRWGYVCDDKFSMTDANVVCRELGYKLGAAEVKSNSYYAPNANMSVASMFIMDEVNCTGQESSLRECDFNGWGISDCNAEEVVGVVCKMPVMKCPSDYFLCEASEQCIPIKFMCDGVNDCSDGADESRRYCNAPIEYRLADGNEFEGRVEVKYRGIWGTVCDDDFGEAEASVLCKSLGFNGPAEILGERIGSANGPIWLDQVFCRGNETCLDKCMHFEWGESNCNHTEDISVRCSHGAARKSAKLMLAQDHNSLSEFDDETQQYIRGIQRNSKSMPDYSNVCGQVKVSGDDVESSAEQLGQFRVINGPRAKRGHHPWQATIRARGRNGKSTHWCGAVVLSKNHILTAAHCLIGFPKGAYFIRLGDHHSEVYEDSEIEIFIEDWFIHEEFRKGQHMNNDIALILLKQPIQFTNYIQPICLPTSNAVYAPGRNCTISGWGSIQYGTSTPSLDLKAANVPLISQDVCRQKHIYGDAIMDTMFCAGHMDQSGVDACDGDSGGPLVCADDSGVHSLYGIISWGQRCGDATKPGVYVKVAKYLDWIKDKMNRPTKKT